MTGPRRIVILSEDPQSLSIHMKEDDFVYYTSMCYCLEQCCEALYSLPEESACFYSLVYPGKTRIDEWKSIQNKGDISDLKICCQDQLQNPSSVQDLKLEEPNFKDIYDALVRLKESVSTSDVVTIIWFVPSFNMWSNSLLSVKADSSRAPFLYLGLQAFISASKSLEITIITHDNTNDLAIWAKLLHATVYWIQPSLIPIPNHPLYIKPVNDSYCVPSTNDSLIIEQPTIPYISILKSTPSCSSLPQVNYNRIYSLSLIEMELILRSLLRIDISQRYRFQWHEQYGHFINIEYWNDKSTAISEVSINMILSDEIPEVLLCKNQPIQIMNCFHSIEVFRILYLFLENTQSFRFSFPHAIKNPFFASHLINNTCTHRYYGCTVMGQSRDHTDQSLVSLLMKRPSLPIYGKQRCLVGMLIVSSEYIELLVSYDEWGEIHSKLRVILEESFRRSEYQLIVDSDISTLLMNKELIHHYDMNTQIMTPVLTLPSVMKPISRDVTVLCKQLINDKTNDKMTDRMTEKRSIRQISQECIWNEEDLLRHISQLTVHDSDQWKLRLFGNLSTIVTPKKNKRSKDPRHSLLLSAVEGKMNRPLRLPHDCHDITRSFLSSGVPSVDTTLFELQPLSLPSYDIDTLPKHSTNYIKFCNEVNEVSINQQINQVYYSCRGEDYWDISKANEETKITALIQKVDVYGSLLQISRGTKIARKLLNDKNVFEINIQKIDKAIMNSIQQIVPLSYRNSTICDKIIDLTTQLCQAVFETLYDYHKIVLPSSTLINEVKKQLKHVVCSLIPSETSERRTLPSTHRKRHRPYSDLSSVLDSSPFSIRDQGFTPDTSLLGTPSSLGTYLGHESKRYPLVPPLPTHPG